MSGSPDPIIERLSELSVKLEDPSLFQSIIDNLPDALLVVGDHGLIKLVNFQTELMFGYPRKLLIGETLATLLPERTREIHAKHFENYFLNPYPRPMNLGRHLSALRKDGREITVQIALSSVINHIGVLALAAIRRVGDGPAGV